MHKLKETIMHVVFLIAALVSIAAVALICVFLFVNGIPAIKEIGFGDFTLGKYICDSRSTDNWSSDRTSDSDISGKVLSRQII